MHSCTVQYSTVYSRHGVERRSTSEHDSMMLGRKGGSFVLFLPGLFSQQSNARCAQAPHPFFFFLCCELLYSTNIAQNCTKSPFSNQKHDPLMITKFYYHSYPLWCRIPLRITVQVLYTVQYCIYSQCVDSLCSACTVLYTYCIIRFYHQFPPFANRCFAHRCCRPQSPYC